MACGARVEWSRMDVAGRGQSARSEGWTRRGKCGRYHSVVKSRLGTCCGAEAGWLNAQPGGVARLVGWLVASTATLEAGMGGAAACFGRRGSLNLNAALCDVTVRPTARSAPTRRHLQLPSAFPPFSCRGSARSTSRLLDLTRLLLLHARGAGPRSTGTPIVTCDTLTPPTCTAPQRRLCISTPCRRWLLLAPRWPTPRQRLSTSRLSNCCPTRCLRPHCPPRPTRRQPSPGVAAGTRADSRCPYGYRTATARTSCLQQTKSRRQAPRHISSNCCQ